MPNTKKIFRHATIAETKLQRRKELILFPTFLSLRFPCSFLAKIFVRLWQHNMQSKRTTTIRMADQEFRYKMFSFPVHDCIVSEYGPWSPCPQFIVEEDLPNCDDLDDEDLAWTERQRVVLHPALNGGAKCPSLVQKKLCPKKRCKGGSKVSKSTWDMGKNSSAIKHPCNCRSISNSFFENLGRLK